MPIELRITEVERLTADETANITSFLTRFSGTKVSSAPVVMNMGDVPGRDGGWPIVGEGIKEIYARKESTSSTIVNNIGDVPAREFTYAYGPVVEHSHLPPIPTASDSSSAPEINVPHRTSEDLDSRGLPWDSRVHARTKSKNADGHWKPQRGLDPKILLAVESQLRELVVAPQDFADPSIPLPPIVEEVVETPVSVAVTEEPSGFQSLMGLVSSAVKNGQITPGTVLKILGEFGIPSLPVAATRLDLLPQIIKRIAQEIG